MRTTISAARRRRDGLTIMADLLETMDLPIKLTHLLYRTNLGHSQLKRHLELLVSMGFVQELTTPSHSFVITEKGRMFVRLIAPYPRSGAREGPAIPLDKIGESNSEHKVEAAELGYDILTTLNGGAENAK